MDYLSSSYVLAKDYSCTAFTIESNSAATTAIDIIYPTGYSYLSITKTSSNYSQVIPYRSIGSSTTDGEITITVYVRNISSSSSFTVTITIRVVYYKDF